MHHCTHNLEVCAKQQPLLHSHSAMQNLDTCISVACIKHTYKATRLDQLMVYSRLNNTDYITPDSEVNTLAQSSGLSVKAAARPDCCDSRRHSNRVTPKPQTINPLLCNAHRALAYICHVKRAQV
jgi:hypothetical protein